MEKKGVSILFIASVIFLLTVVISATVVTFIPFDKRPHTLDIFFEVFSYIALAVIASGVILVFIKKEYRIMYAATSSLWFIIFIISFMLSDHLMYP